ncbi:MAG: EamA family transporter [Desulfovibrionales bacterium]|nr:EamA family transporter [Desulfovibrionales bacterium]
MHNWFSPSIACLILWGIWGFFPKLATNYLPPRSVFIYQAIGTLIVIFSVLISIDFRPEINTRGIIFSILAGLAAALGTVFFLLALAKGKASVVVTMTALYPLITLLLSAIFLKETLTLKQALGVLFSLAALLLFSL